MWVVYKRYSSVTVRMTLRAYEEGLRVWVLKGWRGRCLSGVPGAVLIHAMWGEWGVRRGGEASSLYTNFLRISDHLSSSLHCTFVFESGSRTTYIKATKEDGV